MHASPRNVLRLPAILAVWLLLSGTPACVAEPSPEARGPLVTAQRLLSMDFGRRTWQRRQRRLADVPRRFGSELQRVPRVAALPTGASNELRRAQHLADESWTVFGPELQRYPDNLDLLLPRRHDLSQDFADDLDNALWLFGPSRRPLSEIDDIVHRTDPNDQRPEATLLERLRRRVGL